MIIHITKVGNGLKLRFFNSSAHHITFHVIGAYTIAEGKFSKTQQQIIYHGVGLT